MLCIKFCYICTCMKITHIALVLLYYWTYLYGLAQGLTSMSILLDIQLGNKWYTYMHKSVWCLCRFNYCGLLLNTKLSVHVERCFGWDALVAFICMYKFSPPGHWKSILYTTGLANLLACNAYFGKRECMIACMYWQHTMGPSYIEPILRSHLNSHHPNLYCYTYSSEG